MYVFLVYFEYTVSDGHVGLSNNECRSTGFLSSKSCLTIPLILLEATINSTGNSMKYLVTDNNNINYMHGFSKFSILIG